MSHLKLNINKCIYNIYGYSRGGEKTCIVIPELDVVFDFGYVESKAIPINNKLISHGHIDHIGSLHTDHYFRWSNKILKQQQYIMPEQCMNPYKMVISGFAHMNNGKIGKINMITELKNITLTSSENCIDNMTPLTNEYYCKSFLMDHRIVSFGYIIYRKSKKLKPEYIGLNKSDYIELKKSGIEITNEIYSPVVGYTGDTSINGLLNNIDFFDVPILLMECTGFDQDDIDIRLDNHIHLNDIYEHKNKFNCQKIILYHISPKYKNLDYLLSCLSVFDDDFKSKIEIFY